MPISPIYDVAIVGGGASGLAAAISAARRGATVCVIERDVEAGLPLLATGNGRCNISNAALDARHYRHPESVRLLFGTRPEQDIADFFDSVGLILVQEDEGRLYPVTRRAESVRDALLSSCKRLGVEIISCATLAHAKQDDVWDLTLNASESPLSFKRGRDFKSHIRNARKALAEARRTERLLRARSVVLAVGGRSHDTCKMLGIPHIEEEPVLCPIACKLDIPLAHASKRECALERLDGLRVEAMLTLMRNGAAIAYEQGEVLFRPYGISGIAAFNLSRRMKADDVIELDLLPDVNASGLESLLRHREHTIGPFSPDGRWFDGMLARPIGQLLTPIVARSSDPLAAAATLLHHLPLRVDGAAEPGQAHVHRGGIPLPFVDISTLALTGTDEEPIPAKGLFVCGEALDMDADCGGYNLAWAWLTGIRAGSCAALCSRKDPHAGDN